MSDFDVDPIDNEDFKNFMSIDAPLSDEVRNIHQAYVKRMTTPFNSKNDILHTHWQPWAEKYAYGGIGDSKVLAREATNKRSRGDDSDSFLTSRWEKVHTHGFAIPNEAALNRIAELGPVLEVGSGVGYWAHLLRDRGVDVVAVDRRDCGRHIGDTIVMDGVEYLEQNAGGRERTLLLCWPTYAGDVVKAYRGDHVVVVGENECSYGSTWDMDEDDDWQMTEKIDIPTWPGMADDMRVYQRKKAGGDWHVIHSQKHHTLLHSKPAQPSDVHNAPPCQLSQRVVSR